VRLGIAALFRLIANRGNGEAVTLCALPSMTASELVVLRLAIAREQSRLAMIQAIRSVCRRSSIEMILTGFHPEREPIVPRSVARATVSARPVLDVLEAARNRRTVKCVLRTASASHRRRGQRASLSASSSSSRPSATTIAPSGSMDMVKPSAARRSISPILGCRLIIGRRAVGA
jgi:hypothetical protein